jgi:hypothetical protein
VLRAAPAVAFLVGERHRGKPVAQQICPPTGVVLPNVFVQVTSPWTFNVFPATVASDVRWLRYGVVRA